MSGCRTLVCQEADSVASQIAYQNAPDFISLTGLAYYAVALDQINNQVNITDLAIQAQTQLDQLVTDVNSEIASFITQLSTDLSQILQDIDNSVSVVDEASQALNQFADEVENFQGNITAEQDTIDQINSIRSGVTIGFVTFILVLVGLYLVSVFLGLCFGNQSDPTNRSTISYFSSRTIQLVNIIIWLMAACIMLITMVLLLLGGSGQTYFCVPLQNYELITFTENIVKNNTDFSIKNSLQATGLTWEPESVLDTITLTSILQDCEENQPLWEVVKLNNVPTVSAINTLTTTITDASNTIESAILDEVPTLISNGIAQTNFESESQEIQTYLSAFIQVLNRIDFSVYNSAKSLGVSGLISDWNGWISSLESLDTSAEDSAVQYAIAQAISSLKALDLSTFLTEFTFWSNALDAVIQDKVSLTSQLSSINTQLAESENYLLNTFPNETAVILEKEVDVILSSFIDFSNFVVQTTEQNLGQCQNIYIIYQQTDQVVCDNIINTVNGAWLCLGWLAVTIPFAIFFGMKSSKYFKRYTQTDGFQEIAPYPVNNDGIYVDSTGKPYHVTNAGQANQFVTSYN